MSKLLGFLLIAVLLLLLPALSVGSSYEVESDIGIPQPDKWGDYENRMMHLYWEVVDPDLKGLNARLSTEFPADFYRPDAVFPKMNIGEWPVIRRFPQGTVLIANGTPAGFTTFRDLDNKPWLRVNLAGKGQDIICLVRANKKYIMPIPQPTYEVATQELQVAVIHDPDGYTNIRKGQGTDTEIVGKIEKDTYFFVLSKNSDWWRVRTLGGITGFMHKSRIKTVRTDAVGCALITSSDGYVNLRQGTSTSDKIIAKVLKGKSVILLSPGIWCKVISEDGLTGYIHSSGLTWEPL